MMPGGNGHLSGQRSWSPMVHWYRGGLRLRAEPLAGTDRQVEAVLGRRERAGPFRVEGARRLVGEVEVEHEAAVDVAAQVGALGGVEEVTAGAVGFGAVGRVAERQEQAAGVAGHPEQRQPARPFGERDLEGADAL